MFPVCVGLMFSSPLSCLTGAAVHPCQRGHRGHGGSHSEDMPEHQWPPTRGEQQPVSAPPVCPLRLNRCTQLQTCLACLSLVFFFTSLLSFPVTSTVSSCHLCSSVLMLSCLLLASLPLVFYPAASTLPTPSPLPTLKFNLWFLLQLHKVAVSRTSDLLKVHGEQLPLRALKAAGAEGNLEAVAEYSRTLTERKEQLVEV